MNAKHIKSLTISPEDIALKKENRSVIDELLQILKETKAAISANWRHENDLAELFVAFGA